MSYAAVSHLGRYRGNYFGAWRGNKLKDTRGGMRRRRFIKKASTRRLRQQLKNPDAVVRLRYSYWADIEN